MEPGKTTLTRLDVTDALAIAMATTCALSSRASQYLESTLQP